MSVQTTSAYRIERIPADEEHLEQYRRCFVKHGFDRDQANLQWLHQQNQVHENMIYYAWSGSDIGAIYTALPVYFRINGERVKALQSIDTITDENHRGKGLFTLLANQLYADAPKENYALVYGFPNDQSAPGFFKKLKWVSFGEAPFLIKPIRWNYLLKKILFRKKHTDFSSRSHVFDAPATIPVTPTREIRAMADFGSDYNRIWETVAKTIRVSADRNADYMNWRYVQKPGEHYYRYGLYENDHLQGVIVFSIKFKHDGCVAYIMDLIFDPAVSDAGKWLLNASARLFRREKVDVVLTWCLPHSFNYPAYRQSGYYPMPEKVRPQKLYLGVRSFREAQQDLLSQPANWYISYSDSDTA